MADPCVRLSTRGVQSSSSIRTFLPSGTLRGDEKPPEAPSDAILTGDLDQNLSKMSPLTGGDEQRILLGYFQHFLHGMRLVALLMLRARLAMRKCCSTERESCRTIIDAEIWRLRCRTGAHRLLSKISVRRCKRVKAGLGVLQNERTQ